MNPALWEDYKGIRRFRNTDIQEQIDRVYKKLEEQNKKFGVIAHVDETGAWRVTSVIRLADAFSVQAAVYDNFKNPQGIGWQAEAVLTL